MTYFKHIHPVTGNQDLDVKCMLSNLRVGYLKVVGWLSQEASQDLLRYALSKTLNPRFL